MFECLSAPTLKHSNTQTLKHPNTQTLKHSFIKVRIRILLWLFLFLCAAFVAWKLYVNKKELAAETELSKVGRAYVPVQIVAAQYETLANRLEADGIFLPAKEMFVISETAGRVVEVYKNKGEWVHEGDLIAKVDDELLRTELEATQANLAKLYKDRERLTNLIEGEAAPRSKIEDVTLGILAAEAKEKGLKKQIANTSIKAPMTGTMGLRFIERGSVIGPGIQVAQITNLEKLFLMVKVTERDVLNVRKGQLVSVSPDVYPGLSIPGKVTNIGLRADNAFTYDVEIEVVNPKNNPLRAGMHAKAKFTFNTNRQGLTLPRKAIAGSLQDAKVYVVHDSILAELRPVTLGVIYDDRVEVSSGLKPGEQVVVTGQMNLSDRARVQVVKPN
ncbi:MAG: efflux RND transporter periplasmic adaptor subunit [Haliscomenobacteraceae bacterium CHB4]|nr:efflux RND transporter periplasmic adaptor subunit [Haliscomenobacteraceae bacterium CHB4]